MRSSCPEVLHCGEGLVGKPGHRRDGMDAGQYSPELVGNTETIAPVPTTVAQAHQDGRANIFMVSGDGEERGRGNILVGERGQSQRFAGRRAPGPLGLPLGARVLTQHRAPA